MSHARNEMKTEWLIGGVRAASLVGGQRGAGRAPEELHRALPQARPLAIEAVARARHRVLHHRVKDARKAHRQAAPRRVQRLRKGMRRLQDGLPLPPPRPRVQRRDSGEVPARALAHHSHALRVASQRRRVREDPVERVDHVFRSRRAGVPRSEGVFHLRSGQVDFLGNFSAHAGRWGKHLCRVETPQPGCVRYRVFVGCEACE